MIPRTNGRRDLFNQTDRGDLINVSEAEKVCSNLQTDGLIELRALQSDGI
jgi:hypothetical protein